MTFWAAGLGFRPAWPRAVCVPGHKPAPQGSICERQARKASDPSLSFLTHITFVLLLNFQGHCILYFSLVLWPETNWRKGSLKLVGSQGLESVMLQELFSVTKSSLSEDTHLG